MSDRNIVAFEIPKELLEKVEVFCKDLERPKSYIFRKAVEEYLAARMNITEPESPKKRPVVV